MPRSEPKRTIWRRKKSTLILRHALDNHEMRRKSFKFILIVACDLKIKIEILYFFIRIWKISKFWLRFFSRIKNHKVKGRKIKEEVEKTDFLDIERILGGFVEWVLGGVKEENITIKRTAVRTTILDESPLKNHYNLKHDENRRNQIHRCNTIEEDTSPSRFARRKICENIAQDVKAQASSGINGKCLSERWQEVLSEGGGGGNPAGKVYRREKGEPREVNATADSIRFVQCMILWPRVCSRLLQQQFSQFLSP